jgi:hypothetical protein
MTNDNGILEDEPLRLEVLIALGTVDTTLITPQMLSVEYGARNWDLEDYCWEGQVLVFHQSEVRYRVFAHA